MIVDFHIYLKKTCKDFIPLTLSNKVCWINSFLLIESNLRSSLHSKAYLFAHETSFCLLVPFLLLYGFLLFLSLSGHHVGLARAPSMPGCRALGSLKEMGQKVNLMNPLHPQKLIFSLISQLEAAWSPGTLGLVCDSLDGGV